MTLMTAVMLMIENKDKVISQDGGGVVCLSKGINTDLVLKLKKGTIMCVRELLNHFCP